MTVLSDNTIIELQKKYQLITPFIYNKVRQKYSASSENMSNDIISYGLSSAGYDIRLGDIFKYPIGDSLDPKQSHENEWYSVTHKSPFFLSPYQSILAVSYERFKIPSHVIAFALNKSTYARNFIFANVTPLEPNWEGYLTIEITNLSDKKVKIYPYEGIVQLVFHNLDKETSTPYIGKYQYQEATPILSRVGYSRIGVENLPE